MTSAPSLNITRPSPPANSHDRYGFHKSAECSSRCTPRTACRRASTFGEFGINFEYLVQQRARAYVSLWLEADSMAGRRASPLGARKRKFWADEVYRNYERMGPIERAPPGGLPGKECLKACFLKKDREWRFSGTLIPDILPKIKAGRTRLVITL